MKDVEAKGDKLPTFQEHEAVFNQWMTTHAAAGKWANVVPSEKMYVTDILEMCGLSADEAKQVITIKLIDEEKRKADQGERTAVIKADTEKLSKAAIMVGFQGTPCDYAAGAGIIFPTTELKALEVGDTETTFKMVPATEAVAALDTTYPNAAVFSENRP